MADVMSMLRHDHGNFAVLLNIVERQVNVFIAGGAADYRILRDSLDYFLDYPGLRHHPLEDLVYDRLIQRRPDMAEAVDDLVAGHKVLADKARDFSEAIDRVLAEEEVPRDWLAARAKAFVDGYRIHLEAEERRFFPAAEAALDEDDWRQINGAAADAVDPLFGATVMDRFQALHRGIRAQEEDLPG